MNQSVLPNKQIYNGGWSGKNYSTGDQGLPVNNFWCHTVIFLQPFPLPVFYQGRFFPL